MDLVFTDSNGEWLVLLYQTTFHTNTLSGENLNGFKTMTSLNIQNHTLIRSGADGDTFASAESVCCGYLR